MKDPHPYVRDTTAWTVGRAFEFLHDCGNPEFPALITRDNLPAIVHVRGGALGRGGGAAGATSHAQIHPPTHPANQTTRPPHPPTHPTNQPTIKPSRS